MKSRKNSSAKRRVVSRNKMSLERSSETEKLKGHEHISLPAIDTMCFVRQTCTAIEHEKGEEKGCEPGRSFSFWNSISYSTSACFCWIEKLYKEFAWNVYARHTWEPQRMENFPLQFFIFIYANCDRGNQIKFAAMLLRCQFFHPHQGARWLWRRKNSSWLNQTKQSDWLKYPRSIFRT